jgi:preprotein translocase subunit SecG
MQNLSLNFTLGIDALYWTLTIIFAFVVTLILLLRSGHGYSVHDTEAHSTNFAGEIKEGHGGLTTFLWVFYAFMFVWTIVYFVQHSAEFAIIFAGGG